jgi:CBS domain-containing protein
MKYIPAIKSVMTPFPYSIDIDAQVTSARQFMHRHGIKHLPVTKGKELAGILSDRDIRLYLGPDLDYPEEEDVKVRDVYLDNPYIVDLNERLDVVLAEMVVRQIGSVLITRNGKLAGVFTSTDACSSFAEFLRQQFNPPGGDEAA